MADPLQTYNITRQRNLTMIHLIYLKGQCHEIFCQFLFQESKPSWPLKNRQKWFCLKIRFREDIREISDSAQANTVQSRTLRR